MHEDEMNMFCDWLEELDYIHYTEVWVKPERDDLYGRTFTSGKGDHNRIEIYENYEHSNEEILIHELAHCFLTKRNGPSEDGQAHDTTFYNTEEFVKTLYEEYKEME